MIDDRRDSDAWSSDKHAFSSGATSSEHKPPYSLITTTLLTRTAERLRLGAEKHGRCNWLKGVRDRDFILDRMNHAIGHLQQAAADLESGRYIPVDDDLAAVVVNVMFVMEHQVTVYQEMQREQNQCAVSPDLTSEDAACEIIKLQKYLNPAHLSEIIGYLKACKRDETFSGVERPEVDRR